jgi:SNF2 family DNA or RNA helicase
MRVQVEKFGNRIHLRSDYPTPGLSRSVPGATWSGKRRWWSIPLTMDHCALLRTAFGKQLEIGPELWAWAKEQRGVADRMAHLGEATSVDLRVVPDAFPHLDDLMSNRPYQKVGASFIATGRRVLIADQPGLGKTTETIAGVIESGQPGPYLVVCPKTAIESVWAPEITERTSGKHAVYPVPDGRVNRLKFLEEFAADPNPNRWLIINPEMLRARAWRECRLCGAKANADSYDNACVHPTVKYARKVDGSFPQLFGYLWGAIIFDESHRGLVKVPGPMSQQRRGAMELTSAEGGLRIALSGTPMRGKPQHLWGTLNWLRPDLYTSYWNWVERYFAMYSDGFARVIAGLMEEREEDFNASLKPIMLRRTKSEVAKDLPPKMYGGTHFDPADPTTPIGVWLPLDPKQAKAYKAMETSAFVELDGGELSAVGVLAELTRLKQFATASGAINDRGEFSPTLPSNKFDHLWEMLEERGITTGEGDAKIVVASQFTSVLEVFSEELNRRSVETRMITGKVTGEARARAMREFQAEDGPRVMLINTKAGGVAITLDRADELVFLDETWTPDDQEQVEDRIHRVSRMHNVTIWYLRSLGTVEEAIALDNLTADNIQKKLMDGTRGVHFARPLLSRRG